MKKVVLFGTQKMGEMAYFYFTKDSPMVPAAFALDAQYIDRREYYGLPVVAFEEVQQKYPPDDFDMFIAIGYAKLNRLRAEKYRQANEKGYRLVSYVSSKIMSLDPVETGDNCFILENQVIQPHVRFGNNVFVWSGNHFGHDVVVDDHTWVASHVVVSGNVKIGKHCFIGINASIRDGIEIADETLVGAGAVMLRSSKPKDVYIGKQTEKYPLNSEQFMRMTDVSGH